MLKVLFEEKTCTLLDLHIEKNKIIYTVNIMRKQWNAFSFGFTEYFL